MDATAHVKTVAVKIAKDVMVPGPSPVMQPVTDPVKAVAMVAVADGVGGVGVAVPGEIAQIVRHRAKDQASASALTQKANPSHWTPLPHLA